MECCCMIQLLAGPLDSITLTTRIQITSIKMNSENRGRRMQNTGKYFNTMSDEKLKEIKTTKKH